VGGGGGTPGELDVELIPFAPFVVAESTPNGFMLFQMEVSRPFRPRTSRWRLESGPEAIAPSVAGGETDGGEEVSIAVMGGGCGGVIGDVP